MKKTSVFCGALLAISWITGCAMNQMATSGSGQRGKLTLTGSSTMAPMMIEIGKQFEDQHPLVRVDVQTGGSSRGIRDVRNGVADLGMSSRELKPAELTGMQAEAIAWDGVTFVVHQENPVSKLSKQQLVGIYSGAITNWKSLGGHDAPIIVSNRAEGRSELELICGYLGLQTSQIEADVIDGETQQSIKTVGTNVNAIVYTSIGAAQYAAENGEPLKLLPLDGVPASTETVQSGEFPLARPLLLIQAIAGINPLRSEFLRFAKSPQTDELAKRFGYVPPQRDASNKYPPR